MSARKRRFAARDGLIFCGAIVLPRAAFAALPAYDHVVIVVEENHSYAQITSTYASSAPYINNTLIGEGASFTNAFGEEHASEGNYLWMFSGSRQGIAFNDPCPVGPFASPNLGASQIAAGHSFKGYSEDIPSIGSTVCTSGAYARKHNPWVNFSNVPNGSTVATSSNLRFSDFPSDYSTLPTVSFVIPNQNNDMHNGANPATVATGDTWLQNHLDGYYQWAKTHNSLLILTFDEDNGGTQGLTNPATGANHIVTVFAGAGIAHGAYAEGAGITHVNMLRTLEDMYGLPHAGAQQSLATAAGIGDGAISDIYTQWTADASGNWYDSANWNRGAVPGGVGAVANITATTSDLRTITLDAPVTLNVLNLDNNAYGYTIAGANALALDAVAGYGARVNVATGAHTITAPLTLATNTRFDTAAGATLTITDASPTSIAIIKSGGGVLRANNLRAGALQIDAGTVAILPDGTAAGASRLSVLAIAGGDTPTASLDVADNALIIDDQGTALLTTLKNQIQSGYANGYWNGPGINSSTAAANPGLALGYAPSAAVFTSFPATFFGQSVDENSTLVRQTRWGDANLDGVVNVGDFTRLASNFGLTGKFWPDGDFNYDGIVNVNDFALLASNFGLTATGPNGTVTPQDWANLAAAVPEPALAGTTSLVALGAQSLLRRRRRAARSMLSRA